MPDKSQTIKACNIDVVQYMCSHWDVRVKSAGKLCVLLLIRPHSNSNQLWPWDTSTHWGQNTSLCTPSQTCFQLTNRLCPWSTSITQWSSNTGGYDLLSLTSPTETWVSLPASSYHSKLPSNATQRLKLEQARLVANTYLNNTLVTSENWQICQFCMALKMELGARLQPHPKTGTIRDEHFSVDSTLQVFIICSVVSLYTVDTHDRTDHRMDSNQEVVLALWYRI